MYRWFNALALKSGWAHAPAVAYAKYGVAAFAVLLAVGWLRARPSPDPASRLSGVCWAGAAALVALALGQLIGHAIRRPRPYAVIAGAHVLISRTSDFSFPSDHALVVGAVAAGLLLVDRRLGILAAVLAVAMAVTRVYVGVHYPGDVLAGLAIGAGVAVLGARPASWLLVPVLRRAMASPARALVTSSRS